MLHIEELRDLYSLSNIIVFVQSRKLMWWTFNPDVDKIKGYIILRGYLWELGIGGCHLILMDMIRCCRNIFDMDISVAYRYIA